VHHFGEVARRLRAEGRRRHLHGQGEVRQGNRFAAVDPWLYNEYADGRKLPAEYDNYAAGTELVRWILEQVSHAQLAPHK
jgi:hypothetical protein